MPLVRSPLQSNETLEEFYQRDSWHGITEMISVKLLEFISKINRLFPNTVLFASTSHQRLCIHEAGEKELAWVVIVAYSPIQEYHLSFKVPDEVGPWKDAWMSGECTTTETAVAYFLKAMKETRLWEGNAELSLALSAS